ncbi:O-antigen ligase family protein [Myxococcota bacterium]|nr:O-antigen ligase family protein [Myxococcota bacterium]
MARLSLPLLRLRAPSNPLDRPAALAAAAGLLLAPLLGMAVAGAPVVATSLVVAAVVFAVLLGRPHWAAYAVCFSMFFNHTWLPLGPAQLDPGDLATLILVPIWLLDRMSGRRRPRLLPHWWLVPALLAWMTASLLLAGIPSGVLGRFAREVQMLATCLAVMDLLAEERRLWIAFGCMAAGGAVEIALALPEFGSAYRVGGAYDQPNLFAHFIATAVVPVVALWTVARNRTLRAVLLGVLGVMLLGVVLSISRGTYIALGLALLWWVRANRRQLALLLAVTVVLGVVVPSVRGKDTDEIGERLEMKDESVTHRWATVINGLNATRAHPVFGVGYGQFRKLDHAVEVTSQAGRSAHNFYLTLAATCGLPALLIYLGILTGVMRRLARWQRQFVAAGAPRALEHSALLVKAAQAMMIYLVVTSMTKGVGMTLWVVIGLAGAAAQLPRRIATPSAEGGA